MSSDLTAVWIDHHVARIFRVDASSFSVSLVEVAHHVPRHPKSEARARNHPDDAKHFFRDIIREVAPSTDLLVVGPSTAKINFADFVREHASGLQVVGIETVDHPTDKQIAAYVRQYVARPPIPAEMGGGDYGRR